MSRDDQAYQLPPAAHQAAATPQQPLVNLHLGQPGGRALFKSTTHTTGRALANATARTRGTTVVAAPGAGDRQGAAGMRPGRQAAAHGAAAAEAAACSLQSAPRLRPAAAPGISRARGWRRRPYRRAHCAEPRPVPRQVRALPPKLAHSTSAVCPTAPCQQARARMLPCKRSPGKPQKVGEVPLSQLLIVRHT